MNGEATKVNGETFSTIGYGIDGTGHLNSITYPSGRTVGYQWDGGRVSGLTVKEPNVPTAKALAGLGHDAWGNLTSVTFESGAKSEWLYNAIGASLGTWKVTEAGATAPLETRTYSYDANLNLNGITPDWVSLTHDAKGQLTSAQGYGNALGFSHDSFGNNTSATTNLTQGPDWLNPFTLAATWADNRLPGPLAETEKWTGWNINARGEATTVGTRLNSNVAMAPHWDGLGRLSQIDLAGANQGYLYAPSGMRVQVTDYSEGTRNRRHAYTSSGMLLSEYVPAPAGHESSQAMRVMHATSGAGALSRNLGSIAAGDTVTVTVWFKAPAGVSGAMAIHDGKPGEAQDSKRFVSLEGNGAWQQMTVALTLSRADTLWVHLYGDMHTSTSGNASGSTFVDYDDLLVKRNGNTLLQDGFEAGLNLGSDPMSSSSYYACTAGLASLRSTNGAADNWKRDIIYFGGRAIAEIDAEGIHELHTDHLGTPRVITAGSTGMTENGQPVALGHVEGRQAFAPYGERVDDGAWTTGYQPLTGFTGHLQQDATGLIYMRGRYYSPAWHRFLNSDQGVDSGQFNQFAYVGGNPLQATDPSGMAMTLWIRTDCYGGLDADGKITWKVCWTSSWIEGSADDEWGEGGGGDKPQTPNVRNCEGLATIIGGNSKFIDNPKFHGAWGDVITADSAAIIPSQFGFSSKDAMAPYISQISGQIYIPPSDGWGPAGWFPLFSSVKDRADDKGTRIKNNWTLPQFERAMMNKVNRLNGGNTALYVEIPGMSQVDTAWVKITVPASMPCPQGTREK